MTQQPDLAEALAEAAHQVHATATLPETLRSIVTVAQASLTDVDHAGVTVADSAGRLETAAATDDFVRGLDALQYELHEGPCLDEMTADDTMVVVDRAGVGDPRWPAWLPRAADAGLRSMVAIRLFSRPEAVAVLNLYSTSADVVGQETTVMAPLFATHAAVAYGHTEQVAHLRRAIDSREVIGQAVGIVMERYDLDATRAFGYLVRVASTTETKLRDVARSVVERRSVSRDTG